MSQHFDSTAKDLIVDYAADWLVPLGLRDAGPVTVIDADLATVSAEADKVLRLSRPTPSILHLELQTRWDGTLARRLLRYNVLLYDRHGLPVHSIAILLRPEAEASHLTGTLRYQADHGLGAVEFRYQVLRVWQQPVEQFLTGGLGLLPLAPLTDDARSMLPRVIDRLEERFQAEAPTQRDKLWTSTYLLMGLRYPEALITQLLKGVPGMEDSATYQAILAKGEVRGEFKGQVKRAHQTLLRLGTRRLGAPAATALATLEAIDDLACLDRMTDRLLDATSWDDLLATP